MRSVGGVHKHGGHFGHGEGTWAIRRDTSPERERGEVIDSGKRGEVSNHREEKSRVVASIPALALLPLFRGVDIGSAKSEKE